LPRPDHGLTRRRLLRGAGALAGGGLAARLIPAEAAVPTSRPSIVMLAIGTGDSRLAPGGFRFDNYRSDYPFWSPRWSDVLAGRPLGARSSAPEHGTLVTAFADAGYETVLMAGDAAISSCAGMGFVSVIARSGGLNASKLERARYASAGPLFVAVLGDDVAMATDAIFVGLPPLGSLPSDRGGGLVVRLPGRAAGAGSSDVPMNPLDVAPTVCGLADVPRPRAFVGRDYSALVPRSEGVQDAETLLRGNRRPGGTLRVS
jgi:hypothetical protein